MIHVLDAVRRSLSISYDLAELGAYYRAYHELMAHWREVLGPRIVNVATRTSSPP